MKTQRRLFLFVLTGILLLQSYMGRPTRKGPHDSIHEPSQRRDREMAISRLPPSHPIDSLLYHRLLVPLHIDARRPARPAHHPYAAHHLPARPGRRVPGPRGTYWLRSAGARQLHHIHARKELQVATRHVLAHYAVSKEVPTVQVPCGARRDRGRRHFHTTLGQEEEVAWRVFGKRADGLGHAVT